MYTNLFKLANGTQLHRNGALKVVPARRAEPIAATSTTVAAASG